MGELLEVEGNLAPFIFPRQRLPPGQELAPSPSAVKRKLAKAVAVASQGLFPQPLLMIRDAE